MSIHRHWPWKPSWKVHPAQEGSHVVAGHGSLLQQYVYEFFEKACIELKECGEHCPLLGLKRFEFAFVLFQLQSVFGIGVEHAAIVVGKVSACQRKPSVVVAAAAKCGFTIHEVLALLPAKGNKHAPLSQCFVIE